LLKEIELEENNNKNFAGSNVFLDRIEDKQEDLINFLDKLA
jgi:hypothetical protein